MVRSKPSLTATLSTADDEIQESVFRLTGILSSRALLLQVYPPGSLALFAAVWQLGLHSLRFSMLVLVLKRRDSGNKIYVWTREDLDEDIK